MARPGVKLGNQAYWEAAPVEDLESIDAGVVHPEPAGEIDVDAEMVGGEMVVRPRKFADMVPELKFDLRESTDSLLQAQLVEEPESPLSFNPKQRNRGMLVWYEIGPGMESAVWGDRVMVEEDGIESEYACRQCKGKGHTEEPCKRCGGELSYGGKPCSDCLVLGFGQETTRPSGFNLCQHCNSLKNGLWVGTGWRSRVIIPEKQMDRPITGHVVSVGPETRMAQLGDRVVFSKYAGHGIENKHGTYRTIRESEILQLIRERKKP